MEEGQEPPETAQDLTQDGDQSEVTLDWRKPSSSATEGGRAVSSAFSSLRAKGRRRYQTSDRDGNTSEPRSQTTGRPGASYNPYHGEHGDSGHKGQRNRFDEQRRSRNENFHSDWSIHSRDSENTEDLPGTSKPHHREYGDSWNKGYRNRFDEQRGGRHENFRSDWSLNSRESEKGDGSSSTSKTRNPEDEHDSRYRQQRNRFGDHRGGRRGRDAELGASDWSINSKDSERSDVRYTRQVRESFDRGDHNNETSFHEDRQHERGGARTKLDGRHAERQVDKSESKDGENTHYSIIGNNERDFPTRTMKETAGKSEQRPQKQETDYSRQTTNGFNRKKNPNNHFRNRNSGAKEDLRGREGRKGNGEDRKGNGEGRKDNGEGRKDNGEDRKGNGEGRKDNGEGRKDNGEGRKDNGDDRKGNGEDRKGNGEGRKDNGGDRKGNGEGRKYNGDNRKGNGEDKKGNGEGRKDNGEGRKDNGEGRKDNGEGRKNNREGRKDNGEGRKDNRRRGYGRGKGKFQADKSKAQDTSGRDVKTKQNGNEETGGKPLEGNFANVPEAESSQPQMDSKNPNCHSEIDSKDSDTQVSTRTDTEERVSSSPADGTNTTSDHSQSQPKSLETNGSGSHLENEATKVTTGQPSDERTDPASAKQNSKNRKRRNRGRKTDDAQKQDESYNSSRGNQDHAKSGRETVQRDNGKRTGNPKMSAYKGRSENPEGVDGKKKYGYKDRTEGYEQPGYQGRNENRHNETRNTTRSTGYKTKGTFPAAPMPQEVKVYFRIQQTFSNIESLQTFLKDTVKITDFAVKQKDVTKIGGSTYFSHTLLRKSDASRLRETVDRSKPSLPVQVDCRADPFLEYQRHQKNLAAVKSTMQHLEERSTDFLRLHDRKVSDVEREIAQNRTQSTDLNAHEARWRSIAALEEKLERLDQQEEEFLQTKSQLQKQLHTLPDKLNFNKHLDDVRDRFRKECKRLEIALPVYARRTDIMQMVLDNQVCIVKGETGSGKSTQLVQYLLETGAGGKGIIVCTQPRRVAATALATHVAQEMGTPLGDTVGYKIGSKSRRSRDTKILYTTDHSMLNECLTDRDLTQFSCIVVDEAHERSLYTDLLISMIKRCLPRRPDLRVIVSSATIDPTLFQRFFDGCPVIEVGGRLFPVEVVWTDEREELLASENFCENAVSKVIDIHAGMRELPGDILVFVTSPLETERCCQMVEQRMGQRGDFKCFQLHGKQQSEDQQKVFAPLGRGRRKIVFATNCAETSITIDGVRYVVDCGLAKEKCYDPQRNLNSLRVTTISQSSAKQRMGRAGRTGPGKCFRLFSPKTYDSMKHDSLPEILRIHLGHAILKLAELGFGKDDFEFVESPSEESMQDARELLTILGALEDGKITERGRWIASLPFDPRLGLLTYMGKEQGVLYDSLVLAAVMSAEGGLFYRGTTEEDQRVHDVTKTKFSLDKGDSLTGLNVYKEWLSVPDKEKNQWCVANGLNAKAWRSVRETVNEVCRTLQETGTARDKGFKTRQFAEEDIAEDLRRMVFRCYSSNLCHHLGQEKAGFYAARANRRVHIHPSSCLNTLACVPEWVVFDQMIQTSRDFITGITPVDDSWISELDEHALGFNPEEVRGKTLQQIYSRKVGSKAFWEAVGPSFTRLRQLEEEYCSSNRDVVVIEASRPLGLITVFATGETDDTKRLVDDLASTISNTERQLETDDREMAIAGQDSEETGHLGKQRVVLGKGGEIQCVLMPGDTRKIFIRKMLPEDDEDEDSEEDDTRDYSREDTTSDEEEDESHSEATADPRHDDMTLKQEGKDDAVDDDDVLTGDVPNIKHEATGSEKDAGGAQDELAMEEIQIDETTEEEMREKFSEYGEISYIRNFGLSQKGFWGYLLFKTKEQAKAAVAGTSYDRHHNAQLEHSNKGGKEKSDPSAKVTFKLTMVWCQRPSRGFATIHVHRNYYGRFLKLQTVLVMDVRGDTTPLRINVSNKGQMLQVVGIPNEISENAIKQALRRALWDQEERYQEERRYQLGRHEEDDDEELWPGMQRAADKDVKQEQKTNASGAWETAGEALSGLEGSNLEQVEGAVGGSERNERVETAGDAPEGSSLKEVDGSRSKQPPRKQPRPHDEIEFGVQIARWNSPFVRQGKHDQPKNSFYWYFDEEECISSIKSMFYAVHGCSSRTPRIHVRLINPHPQNLFLTAAVQFDKAEEGLACIDTYDLKDFTLASNRSRLTCLEAEPHSTTSTLFHRKQWNDALPGVFRIIHEVRDQGMRVQVVQPTGQDHRHEEEKGKKKAKTERVVTVHITGRSPDEVLEGRSCIEEYVKGETIDCSNNMLVFTPGGKEMLGDLERETGATVQADPKFRSLVIRGSEEARTRMRELIAERAPHIEQLVEHYLKGDGKPPGLMKALILKYGEDLVGLITDTGLQSARLDFRRHRLRVSGDPQSLEKATADIAKLTEDVWAESRQERPEREAEECSVCLVPIADGQLYRLQLCAHPYCKVCFTQQVSLAVSERALPTVCCHEGCDRPLALRDLTFLSRDGHINLQDLTRSAVDAFIATNANDYHHCPTPDCPAIYRVDNTGTHNYVAQDGTTRLSIGARPARYGYGYGYTQHKVFACPACSTSTCTHCHQPEHAGKPCLCDLEKVNGEDEKHKCDSLSAWRAEDPANRKMCPECPSTCIEKNGGCNHVYCRMCKKHICWPCLKVFETVKKCYDHLTAEHEGIFPRNYREEPVVPRIPARRIPRRLGFLF